MVWYLLQSQDLAQVGEVPEHLYDATVVCLQELSQNQNGKQLMLCEPLW